MHTTARTLALPVPAIALLIAACCVGGCSKSSGSPASAGPVVPPSPKPVATVTITPTALLDGETATATITFSEAVTGLTLSDMQVAGGMPGSLNQIDATTYRLTVLADDTLAESLQVTVKPGAGRDADGQGTAGTATSAAPLAGSPWAVSTGRDSIGPWADLTISGNGLTAVQRFRLVRPGSFLMGTPASEVGRWADEVQHRVTLTKPYWIADTECTQRMWKAVTGANPSHFTSSLDLPVEQVSWNEVSSFIAALRSTVPRTDIRLPTEAEWEFAARAGTTGPFALSPANTSTINGLVWSGDAYFNSGISRNQTVVVHSLPANAWGLYEVHGNVWEWCSDWYVADPGTLPVVDPNAATGTKRCGRGGGWGATGENSRTGHRGAGLPDALNDSQGFRLAITAEREGGGLPSLPSAIAALR